MFSFVGNLHRRPSELVEKILKTLNAKDTSSKPLGFKEIDPGRTTFDSFVTQVAKTTEKDKVKPKSFKYLDKSVISPEHRVWIQKQIGTNTRRAKQLRIMGGKSFLVDDEGNEEQSTKSENECSKLLPMQKHLKKQDSLQSLQSNDSFDSDWSDEENDELEKKFCEMSNKCKKSERADPLKRF